MYPPPALRTSQPELLGSTTGIILTVVVAVIGLAVLIGSVYWADSHPPPGIKRPGTPPGGGDRPQAGIAGSPGQRQRPWEDASHRHVPERGHAHGKPRSWALVAVVLTAFIVGGLMIILHAWPVVWVCAGIVLLAIPAGKAIGIMDDTVSWGSTPAAGQDEPAGGNEPAVPEREHSEAGRSETRTG